MANSRGKLAVCEVPARDMGAQLRLRPCMSQENNRHAAGVLAPGAVCAGTWVLKSDGSRFLELEGYAPAAFVPEFAADNSRMLREAPVEEALLCYRVRNSVGLAVRTQPWHEGPRVAPEVLVPDAGLVVGEKRVRGQGGIVYVRVSRPAKGWLFESRDGDVTLERVAVHDEVADGRTPDAPDAPGPRAEAPLDVDAVRRAAASRGYREVQHNEASRVLGFVSRDGQARINVYYTTGTVGTSLEHPRQGRTQLFRRGITLAELGEILDNPRVHTGAGYHRRSAAPGTSAAAPPSEEASRCLVCCDASADSVTACGHAFCRDCLDRWAGQQQPVHAGGVQQQRGCPTCRGSVHPISPLPQPSGEAEAEEVERQAALVAAEAAELALVHAELAAHARELRTAATRAVAEKKRAREETEQQEEEVKRRRLAEEEEGRRRQLAEEEEARLEQRGRCYLARFSDVEEFKKRARTSRSFETVKHFAITASGGFFLSRDNGNSYWTGGLPSGLVDQLINEGRNIHGQLQYVAVGTSDRYFVKLSDGINWWAGGEDSLDRAIRSKKSISRVAFGQESDSWYVLYTDGTAHWNNLPTKLHNIIKNRARRLPRVQEISLGSNDNWFVMYADGSYNYTLPQYVADECDELGRNKLTNVYLGPVDSEMNYLIRHR